MIDQRASAINPTTLLCEQLSHRSTVLARLAASTVIPTATSAVADRRRLRRRLLRRQSMLKRKRQYKCAFDHVYLVCPPASRSAFKSDVFTDHSEEKQFDMLDDDTLDILESELEKNNSESEDINDPIHTLWVIDDCQHALKEHEKRLLKIFSSYRHRNLSVWLLVQSYMCVPKKVRDLSRSVIQFKMASGKEKETFAEEVLPFFSHTQMRQLLKYIFKDRHDFTWVDREMGTLTRNMDFLNVEESDSDDD